MFLTQEHNDHSGVGQHPPIVTVTPVHSHEALYDTARPIISSQYSLIGPAADSLVGGATNNAVGGAPSQYSLIGQPGADTEPSKQPQTSTEQQQYSRLDHTIRPKLLPVVTDSKGNYESLNFNTIPTHNEKLTQSTTGNVHVHVSYELLI